MTPDAREALQEKFAEARELQQSGKDEEALAAFGKIVSIQPNIAEVHFNIAQLFIKNDRADRAINHATVACALRPKVPDVWKLRADIVRTLSDIDEAKKFREQIGRIKDLDSRLVAELKTSVDMPQRSKPDLRGMPPAQLFSIASPLQEQRWQDAEKEARKALSVYSEVGAVHDALAVALCGMGRYAEAEQFFKTALRFDVSFADIHSHYARLLVDTDRSELALRHVNAALRLAPGQPNSLVVRGLVMKALGRLDFAADDFKRAIAIDPRHSDATYGLCGIYQEEKDYVAIDDLVGKFISKPGAESRFVLMGAMAKIELGAPRDALKLLESTKGANLEEQSTIDVRIAETLQSLGDFDAATEAFERSIRANPTRGETYRVYLTSKKISLDDPLVPRMLDLWNDKTLPDRGRANVGFALAKVMEDNKQYDRVFEFLHPANAMYVEDPMSEIKKRSERLTKLRESMDTIDWSNVDLLSESEFAPIFVTGMPRSGTTLVEQIISSHSTVSGAGEVAYAVRQALRLVFREEGPYRKLDSVSKAEFEQFSDNFQDYVSNLTEPNAHITDKSINTFDYIGLLKMAMPRAKFVIVRRDPRDNLLSIYKNVFPAGGHIYSYNLTAAVECYKMFDDSVNFWRERTPDWFYEIQYEDLVSNPEEETRKLIDAVGLEWEDQCLEFHKNDRRVRTLSVYQVRQPMYKSSTKAWERYRDDLKELFDALGPEYMDAAE